MRDDAQMTQQVTVVGAGVVGLSTAWFLQERGVDVTVIDRTGVASGASWGNAGWLMAGDVTPLPSPETFRDGLRGLTSRRSSLKIPLRGSPERYWFLLQLARSCTRRRWETSLAALQPLAARALQAYDALTSGGVEAPTTPSDHHLAAFTSIAERDDYATHLEHVRASGGDTEFVVMDRHEAQEASPVLSDAVVGAIGLLGQRYIDPTRFVPALADAVSRRGGRIAVGAAVRAVRDTGSYVELLVKDHRSSRILRSDTVVLCTGAQLPELARPFGVRVRLHAGRGYSFSVGTEVEVTDAVYLPSAHLAATPWQGRLRVAGTMEFAPADAPLERARVEAMRASLRPLVRNVDRDEVQDQWVGARPVTADGRPLAGRTTSPRVWVVGGHAMEGMVLGPATAQLTAEAIVDGRVPSVLSPFDPLR